MRVGILGLAQTGKTAVFEALTGAHGTHGGYAGAESVSLGMVKVPDGRLDAVAEVYRPQKAVPAAIEFEDITGMFAHLSGGKSEGRAAAAARDADVLLMVLRAFDSPHVVAPLGRVDPLGEYRAMRTELLLADQEIIENRIAAIKKALDRPGDRDALGREQKLLERCRQAVEEEEGLLSLKLSEPDEKMLRSYSFFTLKPHLCLLNIGEDRVADPPQVEALEDMQPPPVKMCASLEAELMELDEEDRRLFREDAGLREMAAAGLIRQCLAAADMITFFTGGAREVHAWTVPRGTDARTAAGKVHSDMERGFIRAEVIPWDELAAAGSLKEARAHGKLRMEGKEYVVMDGDVIFYHFTA